MMNERTPPITDTTGTNQDHAQQQPDRNAHRGQRNRNFDTSFKFFKGSTAEIGATPSLSNERVSTDKGFEFFQDQLETYILRELKNPTESNIKFSQQHADSCIRCHSSSSRSNEKSSQ